MEGVEAKLIEKRMPRWKPQSLSDVELESVKRLVRSEEGSLPDGFAPKMVAGSSQGWYGLPSEEDVKKVVTKKREGGIPKSERDVLDEMEIELKGKHGVRERVVEILSRKTGLADGGSLEWR